SVSFYTRQGIAYYAINDRAAGRRVIELDLMTSAQRSELQEDEEVTAADRLIVESPSNTGLIVVRALAPEPGLLSVAQNALSAAKCEQQQQWPRFCGSGKNNFRRASRGVFAVRRAWCGCRRRCPRTAHRDAARSAPQAE